MDELLTSIAARKERLDELRPLAPQALAGLEHYYDLELTYTSNAIEGNTLSPVETTLVIEKGITISGKPLKDHLEQWKQGPELWNQAVSTTQIGLRTPAGDHGGHHS